MVNSDHKPLLELYSTTVFLCSEPVPFRRYAIITAYNPNGVVLTQEQNQQLNDLLRGELSQFSYVEVTGASPDFSHQEPSFAVETSLYQAQALAKQYQQNAIFWIDNKNLSIEPAVLKFDSINLGDITSRWCL